MWVVGKITNCMVSANSHEQTAVYTRGSMWTMKSMEKENLDIQMGEFIKVHGKMESDMERGN